MIIISSDSTADLDYLFEERDIPVLPLAVVLGGETFSDGVTVKPNDIYDFVAKTGTLPKTSARSAEEHKEFFNSIRKSPEDIIIHFTISSGCSVTATNARMAAEELGGVFVVDGLSLSTGTGLLVLYACDLRDSGKYTAEQIYKKVLERIPAVQASFYVDNMEYLHKGGRCSGLASFFATALKIKPSLLLKDGKIVVGQKYRGNTAIVAEKYVNNIFDMFTNPDPKRVFITHTLVPDEIVQRVKEIVKQRFTFAEILETTAGSTITSHCGKGTLGVLFLNDGEHEI